MASGGAEEDDGGIPLDIDNIHMLLQVEHEQVQKRTFTNWINSQLSKRCPPSFVSDLLADFREGSRLLDLLEVMSGQIMKRQRGKGLFPQRANIETALSFLRGKHIKLVNINVPDIIDGRPSIILGLVWSIILHCHIEELAGSLSFSSCHSSLDSLSSLDSVCEGPVHAGRTSPLHRRFRMSAKKALLMWVRDQCQKVHCGVHVQNFKSSWRTGEAFLAILCSLRPQLVDLSHVQSTSHLENLETAFHLAEHELHIPRLLEPQDVDVTDPDEKSIMTYVAQFLQYSQDVPAPEDHLQLFPSVQSSNMSNLPPLSTFAAVLSASHQVSSCERAHELTCWLHQTSCALSETWTAAERSSYSEKHEVFQRFDGSLHEQKKPVMTLLDALSRRPELNQEERALRAALGHLEEELQRCRAHLELSLPPPLDSVVGWLQRAEAGLMAEPRSTKEYADMAKEARVLQDNLKDLNREVNHYVGILDTYMNMEVPQETREVLKNRLNNFRVTAEHHLITLEYQETHNTVLDLLTRIRAKTQSWKAPTGSLEDTRARLEDWQETIDHQSLLSILTDSLLSFKEKAGAYTSKAAPGEDQHHGVAVQVKEAESEATFLTQTLTATRTTMERTVVAWETFTQCLTALQQWLAHRTTLPPNTSTAAMQDVSQWSSCQARLNQAGNFLTEVTEASTSLALSEQLSRVNQQWAACMKNTMFGVSEGSVEMVRSLTQEADCLLGQPVDVASGPLKTLTMKLLGLSKKMSVSNVKTRHKENFQHSLPQMLAEAQRSCEQLQQVVSELEGQLAELVDWTVDALDWYNLQKEKMQERRSALDATAKGLISRGSQLTDQVMNKGWDLENLVSGLKETSSLQRLSTSSLQRKITEKEVLGRLHSLKFKQQVKEFPQKQPEEPGLLVAARTKRVDPVGSVKAQIQTHNLKVCSKIQPVMLKIPDLVSMAMPRTLRDPKTESESFSDPQLLLVTCQGSPNVSCQQRQSLLASTKTLPDPKGSSDTKGSIPIEKKTWTEGQPKAPQDERSPKTPVVVGSEVLSKARRMARSRLDRTRVGLHGRIQEALKLFQDCQLSEPRAKKKQRAFKPLQPDLLEEFLRAVEGFGAFCSGFRLQDLIVLSDSVRSQWEAVTEEDSPIKERMAALRELMEVLSDSSVITTGDGGKPQRSESVQSAECRGQPLEGDPPLRASSGSDTNLSHKQSADTQNGCSRSGRILKSCLRPREQVITAHVLNVGGDTQDTSTHVQVVVRSNIVETKQEAERTVIPETAAPPMKRMACPDGDEDDIMQISEKLKQIICTPVDISTLTLPDASLQPDLEEMNDRLQMMLSLQRSEEEGFTAPTCTTRHPEQLRQQLERVQSAVCALHRFLAAVTEIKAEIPMDPSRQGNKADWDQRRRSWHDVRQRLECVAEQCDGVDRCLNAAGMTLTVEDMRVTCQDLFKSLSKMVVGIDDELGHMETHTLMETHQKLTVDDSSQQSNEQRQRKQNLERREGVVLSAALMEIQRAAGNMRLHEPTVPALHQRRRWLEELQSSLLGLVSEASGIPDEELQLVCEETTKAIAERLEQCCAVSELLRSFQSSRTELAGILQRAESTVSEQASYMGKENLQRRQTKVEETKAELNKLGDGMEEVRGVCRLLHSHLRQIPDCTSDPFDREVDELMDQWLDISERTDNLLENLHLALTLWDGVLVLGTEVDSWADRSLANFTQHSSFQTEDEIKAVQKEMATQEERVERFHQRSTEIQSLLQSVESPLELQVMETQIRKKTEQLMELVSEAEDVFRRTVATEGQISGRMDKCFNSLQEIQSSLHSLRGTNTSTILTNLKELCSQLRPQVEQAEGLMEDVQVLASIIGAESLKSLSVVGLQLQEKVRNTQQLFTEVEQEIQKNIKDQHELQTEKECVEQWLRAAEGKDVSLLRAEDFQQRTERLSQLVSSLQSSRLQPSRLLEESRELLEQLSNFHVNVTTSGSKESQHSLNQDVEVFCALSESALDWIRALKKTVHSALVVRPDIFSPVEQKLHRAQDLSRVRSEVEARLEELCVAGARVSQEPLSEEEVKLQVQRAEEQWRELWQPLEPYHRALQADPQLAASYLHQREQACSRVKELQFRAIHIPTAFPRSAADDRALTILKLREDCKSLGLTLSSLDDQRRELTEKSSSAIWTDAGWAELHTRWSALMEELKGMCSCLEEGVRNEKQLNELLQGCDDRLTSLQRRWAACDMQRAAGIPADRASVEALVQEVTDIEQDVSKLEDSITVESQSSLAQQVSKLQNHKSVLERSIREGLALVKTDPVEEEARSVRRDLTALEEIFGNLSITEELPDFNQLKQEWCTIQGLDVQLSEISTRVNSLQRARETRIAQETLHPDVSLAIGALFKDLESLRCVCLQKKKECAESTASIVRQAISLMQRWSHSSPSQFALDDGLHLQRSLSELLSERSFLLGCLGAQVTEKLESCALMALFESQPVFQSLSQSQVSGRQKEVHSSTANSFTANSKKSASDPNDEQSCPAVLQEGSPDTALCINSVTKQGQECISKQKTEVSIICNTDGLREEDEDVLVGVSATDVSHSKTKQSSHAPISGSAATLLNDSLEAQKTVPQLLHRSNFYAWVSQLCDVTPETNSSLNRSPAANPDTKPTSSPGLLTETHAVGVRSGFQDKNGQFGDNGTSTKKVFTIVLDLEPHIGGFELCDHTQSKQALHVDNRHHQSQSGRPSGSTDSQETEVHTIQPQECQNVHWNSPTEQCSSAKISRKEIHKTQEVRTVDVSTLIKSHCDTECLHDSSRAAETTRPLVKPEETTDVCQSGELTATWLLCTQRDSVTSGDAFTAAHSEQVTATDGEEALCGNKRETHGAQGVGTGEQRVFMLLEDPAVTPGQIQSVFPAGTSLVGTAGGPEPSNQTSAMLGILSDIRSSVKTRTGSLCHLKASPGEPEIQLLQTVQQSLACRYQPAQLSLTQMAKQLEEAEQYQRSLQELGATIKGQSAESQWRAALLDATATVQVKAAQLDLVTLFHRKMKIASVFLKVVAAEKEKMNVKALESSALHAESLNALLQTMKRKKSIMEDLVQLSSQLSVHLRGVDSSDALLVQLGDVQEEWLLLEGRVKRELRHASNSICQSSLLLQEAQQLKAKLEGLQISNCQSVDSQSALELLSLDTDLKLYHQVHLHLQSQFDALTHFSLGQKEKHEIQVYLQGIKYLLNNTETKLKSFTNKSNISTKFSKQLKDLIIWAKQVENHICVGEKLSLFPEEARVQISEMKKFQADILSKRSKMQLEIEEMKKTSTDMEKEESDHIMKTVGDLYHAIAASVDHVLDRMRTNLKEREKLLCEFASMDTWLAETHAKIASCDHIQNVSMAESQLQSNKLAIMEIENQQNFLEALSERCKSVAKGLIPGESRYIVHRLSGSWTELDRLLAQEKVTKWELEEFLHKRAASDEELASIEASLKRISADLKQQMFPLTQERRSQAACLQRMLTEHQFEVRELQECLEPKRGSLLSSIKELQDGCKSLIASAFEHEKYLHLRRRMEESRSVAETQIQQARNKALSVGERFRLYQTLLMELPLIKTQCQEAADQLEAIAQDLNVSELESEKEKIHLTVEALEGWEHSTTNEIKSLESKLLLGLRFNAELSSFMGFLQTTRGDLEKATPVSPQEEAVDLALEQCWGMWRNLESWMRVLEGLGRKEKVEYWKNKELYSLKDAVMLECRTRMVSLSEARESLKDYQWAAQGAISFLHNAEPTLSPASRGLMDFTDEQLHIQQELEALEDGFQTHFSNIVKRVPKQSSLSQPKMEQLHISILSQLQVERALLEAQAQLRLDSLQRCKTKEQCHRKIHDNVSRRLSDFEAQLSDCAAEEVTSHDQSVCQQSQAKLLLEHLQSLTGAIEDLRTGCPRQSCGAGNDGELGVLWHRWVCLRQAVGLLIVKSEQREEEWKDVTESMEQCCSYMARLEAKVPDPAMISFTQNKPRELLAQAELLQAGLKQQQQSLASIERRLELALSLSNSSHPISPGILGKTLLKIQEKMKSLKEGNQLVVAAAQAEEEERERTRKEAEHIENHVADILQELQNCSDPNKRQELMKDLLTQKTRLQCNMDKLRSRYGEIPAESRTMQQAEQSLQTAEEKLLMENSLVGKVSRRVKELSLGLDRVTTLLERRSPTVARAQDVLKNVWDELDKWHSSLMLLESEVQDLAEEQPDHGQLLIDQLTHPLQLYQNAAQMAEHRTAFLNKIPSCLQELQDILSSASCWLDEARLWLRNPCSFTTAKTIQNHAKSLQLVLDDSKRLRHNLEDFRLVLAEISQVCDVGFQERRLDRTDQQVQKMQCSLLEPLEQLLQGASVIEEVEAELKTIERNISKVETILSSVEVSNIPLMEHMNNREVILANVQSMRRTLKEIERYKDDPHVPPGAQQSLLVFPRAGRLLQQLEELEKATLEQVSDLKTKIMTPGEADVSQQEMQPLEDCLHSVQDTHSEEEEDEEDKLSRSSSSDTLTCTGSEDVEEVEDLAEINPDAQSLESSDQPLPADMEEKNGGAEAVGTPLVKSWFERSSESKPGLKALDNSSKAVPPGLLAPVLPPTLALRAADHQETPNHKPCGCQPAAEDKGTPWTKAEASQQISEEEIKKLPVTAPHQHCLFSSKLCLLHEFEVEQRDIVFHLKDAPNLEGLLGKHLRQRPGEASRLQPASQSLLRGIARLVALGEGCMRERQSRRFQTLSQLQSTLCRDKKLLCLLASQMVFVQYLLQHEPRALECQMDEWVQLEARVGALQQQALERDASAQRWLQEWTHWEEGCGQLGEVLDEGEAFISWEREDDDNGGESVKHRMDACQQMLLHLDDSRAALGLFLDRGKALHSEPTLAAPFKHTGGALELRWNSNYTQIQQEVGRCRDVLACSSRFKANFPALSEELLHANTILRRLSALADIADPSQECVRGGLIKLLGLSMEVEATSALKTSVFGDATQLLHLREADFPELRAQLNQAETSWNQLTNHLCTTQAGLQQRLLSEQLQVELLSDLHRWLDKVQPRLQQEEERLSKATDAAQISDVLQRCKALKTAVSNGQLLLDFLCQPKPQTMADDVLTRRSEVTTFAEELGAFRLEWLQFHRQIESQIREGEERHHTCENRERNLQRHHIWIDQQRKHLNELKQPICETVVRDTLEHWEMFVGRVNEVATAVQELKSSGVRDGRVAEWKCDVLFSEQADSLGQACLELLQQLEAVKPVLQQAVGYWTIFHSKLRDAALNSTRVRCALQQRPSSFFSLEQAERSAEILQDLQGTTEEGVKLWADIDESFLCLVETVHHKTAEVLRDKMKEEQKRWKETMQELKQQQTETAETISMWKEHARRSESCARQWEELLCLYLTPEEEETASSVEKLQGAAKEMQSNVGGVLEASKSLIGRLELLPGSVIESEIRKMSHDVLLLNQTITGKVKRLQEDSEERTVFHSRLELIEEKMKNVSQHMHSPAPPQQLLSDLSDLLPFLVEIRAMTSHMEPSQQEMDRLNAMSRKWVESVSHISDILRVSQAESQKLQSFQEKVTTLMSLQEKLQSLISSDLQMMLADHQRLQAEMISGHQLVQSVVDDAAESLAEERGEKRSEVVCRVKQSWINAVAAVEQQRLWMKEQTKQWTIYRLGRKFLWKLLRGINSILPPTGLSPCTLHQLHCWADIYQSVERSLVEHAALCDQTLGVGRSLNESRSECRSGLQSELQALEEAWEQTAVLMSRGRDRLTSTMQTWSRCEDGMKLIISELDLLQLNQSADTEEALIQENSVSLQRAASGLREVSTMKTDLSKYVAASDSALLEQRLEQLHYQWEELCTKVSLRRQEIADRVNAWTIFNDKNKEFCEWLTQMENKVCHSGDLSIQDMVEKLKKDCMEEINLFSENKSHLKQLGEQLLLAHAQAKHSSVPGSLQEVNQRWHSLFHHIESRVKKLKETLVTVQQLDKNMSNLRSWLCRIEAELSRPITYSVCHQQEIQRRLAEQQELQRDIEQHTEGVASVLSLCDVLLRDEDAAGGLEAESDSLQETSRSLDQRWRSICAMALDRRLRIEETWTLWCKFLNDYSHFEDWLKMAERSAANPNSANVLFTLAKEELKRFEGLQRQVNERLTQLELVNNQYRRLARENRTDRASKLKAMVHEGNRRWDVLHRRVAAILRRLKYFTSQREEFEGTRESLLVWLTELDLQLTNVEHFSQNDVHQKIQQLNSFQKEIAQNTERIDGLIVFGEGLIQKSSPQDAALIEDELEELHSYCQEVFSRLVRFHQRLSQPTIISEPELSGSSFSLESSLELIGRPLLGRSLSSFPATPTHLLTSPLERSGRETPVSVDSLPLEWDHTGDVGGSSSHEDDEDVEEDEEGGRYFSALSAPSRSMVSQRWRPAGDPEEPTLTSTPLKQSYLRLMSASSGSVENIKRVSLMLDSEEQPEEFGLTNLTSSEKQSGVIERWELLQAQSRNNQEAPHLLSDLDKISSWLENAIPELERLQQPEPAVTVEGIEGQASRLKEMHRTFAHYKTLMLSLNLGAEEAPALQDRLCDVNRAWSRACTSLQQWDAGLRRTLLRCQEFHETLHSLLLWLAHAESRRYAVDISHPDTPVRALQQHTHTLTDLQEELRSRQVEQNSLQDLWCQLQPEDGADDSEDAREKLHVTGSRLKLLLKQVEQDLHTVTHRLDGELPSLQDSRPENARSDQSRERRGRSFFSRVLRAAFPLQLLLLLLLLLPFLISMSESDPECTITNNFARSFHPMLHYTNGPPPT